MRKNEVNNFTSLNKYCFLLYINLLIVHTSLHIFSDFLFVLLYKQNQLSPYLIFREIQSCLVTYKKFYSVIFINNIFLIFLF